MTSVWCAFVVLASFNWSKVKLSLFCSGCWSLQIDKLDTAATLRSLYWPGFVAFHQLDSQLYGWMYVGTGKKNWDVPFMILPLSRSKRISVVEGGEFPFEMKADQEIEGEGDE